MNTFWHETIETLPHASVVIGSTLDKITSTGEVFKISPFDTVLLDASHAGGIKDVRAFSNRLQLSPQFGLTRLGIILAADQLTHEAQSALLKLLEEPPKSVKIILFISRESNILPTVLSRCRVYREETAKSQNNIINAQNSLLDWFVEAEILAKNDDLLAMANDWLQAEYDSWCSLGRPMAGCKRIESYWHFHQGIVARLNKRLLLEQLVVSS